MFSYFLTRMPESTVSPLSPSDKLYRDRLRCLQSIVSGSVDAVYVSTLLAVILLICIHRETPSNAALDKLIRSLLLISSFAHSLIYVLQSLITRDVGRVWQGVQVVFLCFWSVMSAGCSLGNVGIPLFTRDMDSYAFYTVYGSVTVVHEVIAHCTCYNVPLWFILRGIRRERKLS